MTNSKHTSGPWHIEKNGTTYDILSETNGYIAELNNNGDDYEKANAQIISLAPEMIESIQYAHDLLSGLPSNREINELVSKLADIIKKSQE